jgi:lipopolysaccharide export system protein LptC
MAATTDFAIVLADQDIVLTDRPVNIIMGGNRLAGTGMELNSRTRQLRLDSSVQAVLQAPAAP